MTNVLKINLRQEVPEATIALQVIKYYYEMTIRAKSRADYQVERMIIVEQKIFQESSSDMEQTAS